MVYHAVSKKIQKIRARRAENAILQQAFDQLEHEHAKPKGVAKMSLRKVAEKYKVARSTLSALFNGKRESISTFNASKQKLSVSEERLLVDYIKESANLGFPFVHRDLEAFADAVIQARTEDGSEAEKVGKSWVFRFLERHETELQAHWSRPLDTQRANALNPTAVQAWFDLVEKFIVKLGVLPENIYGMDESGFPPSHQGRQRVIGS